MHVIAVEYPGYGVYRSAPPTTADRIVQDAETVYKFLTKTLKWEQSDIIVCGRSIGCGPACHLASVF